MYDHLGIMFFIVIAVITALAIIRSLVKMKKRTFTVKSTDTETEVYYG